MIAAPLPSLPEQSVVSENATMLVGIIELDFIKFKMD
jgi:hypothetical protein